MAQLLRSLTYHTQDCADEQLQLQLLGEAAEFLLRELQKVPVCATGGCGGWACTSSAGGSCEHEDIHLLTA